MSRNEKSPEAKIFVAGVVAAAAFMISLLTPARASAQSFTLVGAAANSQFSAAYAITPDGRISFGTSYRDGGQSFQAGWSWSSGAGRIDTGLGPDFPRYNDIRGASIDGSVVVGWGSNPGTFIRAMRYSGPGTYQELGTLTGDNSSQAFGVSADGSVVVGKSYLYVQNAEFASRAFRWTAEGGMQPLTNLYSVANAVSADGNTIAGEVRTAGSIEAFRWTTGGGFQVLPRLPDAPPATTWASGINASGDIIVGRSNDRATVWRNGVPEALACAVPGIVEYSANAVNIDGSVVVGRMAFSNLAVASVWTPSTDMIRLSDYLASHGVTVPAGVTLTSCTAVSADGMTFVGYTSGSVSQGFVATIPAPASALLLVGLIAPRRRRSS